MWIQNPDTGQWTIKQDNLAELTFSSWLQDQQATEYYSRCLNGATFVPTTGYDNIYDILSAYQPRTWFVALTYSTAPPYIPSSATKVAITGTTSLDYYSHFLPEYGLTLKNLFTPKRLVNNEIENYNIVDIATTGHLSNVTQYNPNLVIDGIKLLEGHRVLVKDQISTSTLPNTQDPNTYFTCNFYTQSQTGLNTTYYYYNSDNGIYKYTSSALVREPDLNVYDDCIRYSVVAKLGMTNSWDQFHLSRLLSGYFPSTSLNQPIEFLEKHNYVLRNQIEYINLFEITYNDIIQHGTQSIFLNGVTYSIPPRIISVANYGTIVVVEEGVQTILDNKFQYNLMSITEVSDSYWVCGDYGTLLKISKIDLSITRVNLGVLTILNSVSFFSDSRGVVVGSYNIIFITDDGGSNWNQIEYPEFMAFSYNSVLYYTISRFAIGGNTGVFIDFIYSNGNWVAYHKLVAKFTDINNSDDEYLLVENINKLSVGEYSPTQSVIMLLANNGNIIYYDFNHIFSNFDFRYFDNGINYGNILNFAQQFNTPNAYFTSDHLYQINLNNYNVTTSSNNIDTSTFSAIVITSSSPNQIFDYQGQSLVICGNNSLLSEYDYTTFSNPDPTFDSRLTPRMLFLDYDIGSKLNFWDSTHNYRLPNAIIFSASNINTPGIFGSTNLIFYPLTQSGIYGSNSVEMNWMQYWQDRGKTFEYYTHLDDPFVVKPSFTFSTSNVVFGTFSYTASQITTSLSDILPMAPNISSTTQSRYIDSGLTIALAPYPSYFLYVYDYLMIWVVFHSHFIAAQGLPVPGDMVHITSNDVDCVLMINKVISQAVGAHGGNPSGTMYYSYIYTNFTGAIINNIQSSTVSITNLNKYTLTGGSGEFITKFNKHPAGFAYQAGIDPTGITMSITPIFTNKSAYYNLQTGLQFRYHLPNSFVNIEMQYEETFFRFGYDPTYNLLDYLSQINPNNYFPSREFAALPIYQPMPSTYYTGFHGASNSNIYVSSNVSTQANKLYFGSNLVDQWTSLFQWTFVDVILYDEPPTILSPSLTQQLLIMNKYYDSVNDQYIIEFHKSMESIPPNPYLVEIQSRRQLSQISGDLQYLNAIHRPTNLVRSIETGTPKYNYIGSYTNYETDINFKIPTDSYARVFLSDDQFVKDVSALIYIDNTNELSLNITKLEKNYQIPIVNTGPITIGSDTYVLFICGTAHHLTEDGVVITMNGGTGSSQQLNQQYMGYHVAHVVNYQDFYIEVPYGLHAINDIGIMEFTKRDPFLIFQPINIFDLAQDKTVQQAVAIQPENYEVIGTQYDLINIDPNNYTYQLRDGLTIETVTNLYPWILTAEISNAIIGLDSNNNLLWYDGVWECGRWFGGTWLSGAWLSGDWYSGTWNSKPLDLSNPTHPTVNQLVTETATFSIWYTGRWFDGNWTDGTWYNGRWYGGTWSGGEWFNGVWNNGTWTGGSFSGGIWVNGTWWNGDFNCDVTPAYWLDGKWYGGDFQNGMWYNGLFDQKNSLTSRFGTKSFNTRTSTWQSGKWISGQFHSYLNLDLSGNPQVSTTHKYSTWKTGFWGGGDFFGGIAYNIDFRGGEWHGGILEDIQLIGIDSGTMSLNGLTMSNFITLNGIFEFNIGDEFWIIDNNIGNTYSALGSNQLPRRCKALFVLEDTQYTYIEIDVKLGYESYTPFPLGITASVIDTGLWVVSKFTNATFDSGIWTNGILDSSYFNGGIWYNGVVENSTFQ